MEQAKAAIKEFTSQQGHHETTVHEHHKPAVIHQHITPTQHEETTQVVDREVHQDHYHTSVQPLQDREILPEKHQHNLVAVEHRETQHGDTSAVEKRLAAEAAQFKDVSEIGKTRHTRETKPVVAGEHVHHHVHETIQPVIQKETVQPTVIHTTVPVHEVHHNEAKHHAASALPSMNLEEFKKAGGTLTGSTDRVQHFDGEPRIEGVNEGVGAKSRDVDYRTEAATGDAKGSTTTDRDRTRRSARAGATTAANKIDSRVDQQVDPAPGSMQTARSASGTTGERAVDTAATKGAAKNTSTNATNHHNKLQTSENQQPATAQYADTHAGSIMDTAGDKPVNTSHHSSNFEAANVTKKTVPASDMMATGGKKRSSLLDKLNPMKDANGDGRKGVFT